MALLHDRNNIVSEHSNIDLNISNNKGLEWALENKTRLADFVKKIAKVYSRQEINILKKSELAWYAYSINGLLVTPEMEEFLTGICSGNLGKTSCTYYAYKKLLSSNNSKVTMNRIFKFNMIMKLWGIYQDDVPVSRLNVDIDELVKIEDIIK